MFILIDKKQEFRRFKPINKVKEVVHLHPCLTVLNRFDHTLGGVHKKLSQEQLHGICRPLLRRAARSEFMLIGFMLR